MSRGLLLIVVGVLIIVFLSQGDGITLFEVSPNLWSHNRGVEPFTQEIYQAGANGFDTLLNGRFDDPIPSDYGSWTQAQKREFWADFNPQIQQSQKPGWVNQFERAKENGSPWADALSNNEMFMQQYEATLIEMFKENTQQ